MMFSVRRSKVNQITGEGPAGPIAWRKTGSRQAIDAAVELGMPALRAPISSIVAPFSFGQIGADYL